MRFDFEELPNENQLNITVHRQDNRPPWRMILTTDYNVRTCSPITVNHTSFRNGLLEALVSYGRRVPAHLFRDNFVNDYRLLLSQAFTHAFAYISPLTDSPTRTHFWLGCSAIHTDHNQLVDPEIAQAVNCDAEFSRYFPQLSGIFFTTNSTNIGVQGSCVIQLPDQLYAGRIGYDYDQDTIIVESAPELTRNLHELPDEQTRAVFQLTTALAPILAMDLL